MKTSRHTSGISLIEVLLVMAIVAMVAVMGFPMFGYFREKAGLAGCISHMRIMHVGFSTYMIEHENIWPQAPEFDVDSASEIRESRWWAETMKDYGIAKSHWICPSDNTVPNEEKKSLREGEFYGSYLPTLFDNLPNTAFNWKQPWVIEKGIYHGAERGPNILMPDGSIQEGPSFMAAQ